LYQQTLSRAADTIHALLSVVPKQGTQTVEAARQQALMQGMQMGNRKGILEFLCVVQGTGAA